ncbi:serine/arginine repetitive matrix protein 1-like [Schistocerca serialis cubense]|uniref:serine/arginine repetitive matrix protein 1-like n=1 Tax=Schistocerca serialis cubense TaxID=2023355 RepID=UPI00214E9D8B|nr:serine/arginine repetitive matrix protein 1-like [Schistocerca serialis cubense]
MFRRWKWFRRRRRSASAQRTAVSALRDDRIVREALDDYVRDAFSPASASGLASRTRCSVRRLPLEAAPKGVARWHLDEELLYSARRRSYTVLYLRKSPTDLKSKAAQPDPESGEPSQQEPAAAVICDCTDYSSCPHASSSRWIGTEQVTTGEPGTSGEQANSRKRKVDAASQTPPPPRKRFSPCWRKRKERTDESRVADEQVTAEEQKDEEATPGPPPRKRMSPWRRFHKQRSSSEEESRRAKRIDTKEAAIQVDRSAFLISKSSQTSTPRPHVVIDEPTEEPIAGTAAEVADPSESSQVEADTQTDEQPAQQTVVRVLPGPSGLPTIVIESTGNWDALQSSSQTSDVAVQAGRPAKAPRPRLDIAAATRGAASQRRQVEEARHDGSRNPGSMRWSEWDDKQSPWAAAEKYTIRDTNEESPVTNGSSWEAARVALSLQEERQYPSQPGSTESLALRELPAISAANREAVAAAEAVPAGAASPVARRGSRVQRRRSSAVRSPSPTPASTSTPAPPTPPASALVPSGQHRHNVKRHDCLGQHQDPHDSGS